MPMLKTVEKVLLLQELEMFREATSDQLAALAMISKQRGFQKGETLFRAGDKCHCLVLLVSGRVRLGSSEEAPIVETTVLDPLAFFAGKSHDTTGRAISAGTLLESPQDELNDLLISEGEFGWIVLRQVARLGRHPRVAGGRQAAIY